MMKKTNDYKIKYTLFDNNKENTDYLKSLSNLIKLNILYEKKLLSKNEYRKVKCAIGFIAPF